MKTRISVFVIVALAALFVAAAYPGQTSRAGSGRQAFLMSVVTPQATSPPYLSQFPPVERVKAEIKGADPIDTAARQAGAFWQFQQMIKVLAGPRFRSNEFTPDENRLLLRYGNAWQWYLYKENAPPPQDQPRWSKLRAFYENDPGFLDELLQRFFSSELRAEYSRVTGKQPPPSKGVQAIAQPSSSSVLASNIPQQSGTAVLSVVSGFANQPGTVNPLAGRSLVLFKESFGEFLRRKGMFQGPPGSSVKASPLGVWALACQTGSPACQQALYEMRPNSVSEAKMDLNGKATLPGVPAGTYYLFAVAAYNKQFLVWDLRVDLKPGANLVTLDQRNTAPLDADQSRTQSSGGGGQSVAESKPCQASDATRTARPGVPANSTLSVIGTGYVYTYEKTDRATGRVLDSFTERGNFNDTTLYLLDEDAESVLERAGVQPGILGSRVAMVSFFDAGAQVEHLPGMDLLTSILGHPEAAAEISKLAKADLECAMKAIRAHSLAQVTTDSNARGTFPSVQPGTYYLYGRFYRVTKPVRAGGMIWNLRVELKPGQNIVRLGVSNAAYK